MATHIIHLCDPHLIDSDERVEGQQYEIAVNGKPRLIDLCDAHRDSALAPLLALLDAHGRPAGATPPAVKKRTAAAHRGTVAPVVADVARKGRAPVGGRNVPCLLCGVGFATGGGYLAHLRSAHDVASQTALYGGACPLCGHESGRNLGRHVASTHPEHPNLPSVFVAAREAGDPHGVVAARVAAAG